MAAAARATEDMAVSVEAVVAGTHGLLSCEGRKRRLWRGRRTAALHRLCFSHPGKGGPFGGDADDHNGGGGGALGGAIFSDNGYLRCETVPSSTIS